MFRASVIALHRGSRSQGVRLGEGTATVGTAVGAAVRVGAGDDVTGTGVPVMLGTVLPAAGGDSVGEGAALPTLGDESPPEPAGVPHDARRTKPTRHVDAARVIEVTS